MYTPGITRGYSSLDKKNIWTTGKTIMNLQVTATDSSRAVKSSENIRRRAKLVIQYLACHGAFIMFHELVSFITD